MTQQGIIQGPRIVAWESTVACNLVCVHCRASAQTTAAPNELTTQETFDLIDQLAEFSQPIFVISGGEPLMRPDIYDIAAHGTRRGLRVAVSPNGTLLTSEVVSNLIDAGVQRVSVSIDGSTAARHDAIRGVFGAFDSAMAGLARCREAGLAFQLNTTVMRQTRDDLAAVRDLAVSIGAQAWHVFMLVPTGRGRIDDEVSPDEYETIHREIYAMSQNSPIPIRVTCGPQFQRVAAQRRAQDRHRPDLAAAHAGGGSVSLSGLAGRTAPRQDASEGSPDAGRDATAQTTGLGMTDRAACPQTQSHPSGGQHPGSLDRTTRGCLAGDGYCFISHRGDVTPCGYFPVAAGNIREQPFRTIYLDSPLFCALRDLEGYGGKCGACEFLRVCGGCRARAYSLTGDYLAEEPYCTYQPHSKREKRA